MAIEWSDDIVVAELADEPALSEQIGGLIDRLVEGTGGKPHMVLSFADVTYINSSNIAQLLQLRRAVEAAGRQLRLCSVNSEIRQVMEVTGLQRVFVFAPDQLTALAGLQIDDAG